MEVAPGPLAEALKLRRAWFNAAFQDAHSRCGGPDAEEFAAHLCGPLNAAVAAAAAADAACAEQTAAALYLLSLELFTRKLLGAQSHHPAVALVWSELLPRLGPLLAKAPQTAAALCNAALHLSGHSLETAARWCAELAALAAQLDEPDKLLAAGAVIAWRRGLAHYRDAALSAWKTLPGDLQLSVLGLDADAAADEIAKGLHYPWQLPGERGTACKLCRAAKVGGFRGFGGQFLEPPLVSVEQGVLYAFDGEAYWSIHADCFGATLCRAASDPSSAPESPSRLFRLEASGRVQWGELSADFPELSGWSSHAFNDHTLAVTLGHSYHVYLVAAKAGGDGRG